MSHSATEIAKELQRWQRYVSKDGKRQDAAHCFVHPLLQDGEHPNLHLLVHSKVIRVIFDESSPPRAVGIEYKTNEDHQPSLPLSKPVHHIIKATKLVVVSAGALGTPQILERSGVGNPEILRKLDIPVVSNLPGVGENYQDHHLLLYPYKSSLDPEETLDCIFSGRKDFVKALGDKDPMLGWNAIGELSCTAPPRLNLSVYSRPQSNSLQMFAPSFASLTPKRNLLVPNSRRIGNAILFHTQPAQSCFAVLSMPFSQTLPLSSLVSI